MAITTEYVNFAKATGGAPVDQSIALSAAPKAMIFWATAQTAAGAAADLTLSFGATDGSTRSRAIAASSEDVVPTSNTKMRHAAKVITILDASGTLVAEADWKDWTDGVGGNGVTITWTTNDANAYIIHGLAFFGLDNQWLFDFVVDSTAAATDNDDITGFGFNPSDGNAGVILFSAINQSTVPNSANVMAFAIGAASGNTERGCIAGMSLDNLAVSNVAQVRNGAAMLQFVRNKSGVIVDGGIIDFSAWITDGMRITYDTVPDKNYHMFGLIMQGDGFFAGEIESPAGTGTVATTDPGFTPTGVFNFGQVTTAANASVSNHLEVGFAGGASAAGTEGAIGVGDSDNLTDTDSEQNTKTDKVFSSSKHTGDATQEEADLSSFDTNGLTWDFTKSLDPQKNPVYYLVCGPRLAGAVATANITQATVIG